MKRKLGDFNSYPNKGRFFKDKELKCFIDVFELVCPSTDRSPSDYCTYKPKYK